MILNPYELRGDETRCKACHSFLVGHRLHDRALTQRLFKHLDVGTESKQ
jgi:hypothetical protein